MQEKKKFKSLSSFSKLSILDLKVIMDYTVSPSDIFSFMRTCKRLFQLITTQERKENITSASTIFHFYPSNDHPKRILPGYTKKIKKIKRIPFVKACKIHCFNIKPKELRILLQKFPNLEKLDISYCKWLDDSLFAPEEILIDLPFLKTLKQLDISAGGNFGVKSFSLMENLQELIIETKSLYSGCNKKKLSKKECKCLKNLRVLKTCFISMDKEGYQYMKKMESFDIFDGCFYLEEIGKHFKYLKELFLYQCNISNLGKEDSQIIKTLEHLKKIRIWHVGFNKEFDFSCFKKIEELDVAGEFKDHYFQEMKNLKKLKICRSTNSDSIFDSLPNLISFESDGIDGKFLTKKGISKLKNIRNVFLCCKERFSDITCYKKKCTECGKEHIYCDKCDKCGICSSVYCKENTIRCDYCQKLLCKEHKNYCEKCTKHFCSNCNTIHFGGPLCEVCELEMCCSTCLKAFTRCKRCRKRYCEGCVHEGFCEGCKAY